MRKDLKPIFSWAKQNGDANIYDRIIVKTMPILLQNNLQLNTKVIESSGEILVSTEVYELILSTAQNLTAKTYKE
jgi:hypothetical protein